MNAICLDTFLYLYLYILSTNYSRRICVFKNTCNEYLPHIVALNEITKPQSTKFSNYGILDNHCSLSADGERHIFIVLYLHLSDL